MALGGLSLRDASSRLRTATRRAKSDVANKLVSMFLHELSRFIYTACEIRVDGEIYESLVREHFANQCPYCLGELSFPGAVIEHLDGMNRLRGGLHVPGNVLVACARCNSEKRRDDSLRTLSLGGGNRLGVILHPARRLHLPCGLPYLRLLGCALAGFRDAIIHVGPKQRKNQGIQKPLSNCRYRTRNCADKCSWSVGQSLRRLPSICGKRN